MMQQEVAARQRKVNKTLAGRAGVSTVLAFMLIGLATTGVLSYCLPYGATLSGLHTWFGFGFLALIILHLSYNGRTLFNYLRQRGGRWRIALGVSIALAILLGVASRIPPFSTVLDIGTKLRKASVVEDGRYQIITTHQNAIGPSIRIEIRVGKYYQSDPQRLFLGFNYRSTPQMAFWLEDMQGNYIDTLYVTQKISNSSFRSAELFNKTVIRRPEALPYWAHKRGIVYRDGLSVPDRDSHDLDGVTSATMLGHYDVKTVATTALKKFRVLMEVNRSFDFNAYYSKDRFPDDPIYSGSGSSGQPSVIYEAVVDTDSSRHFFLMQPIGHGHPSGRNGDLYTDITGIDTAFEIIQRALVEVE